MSLSDELLGLASPARSASLTAPSSPSLPTPKLPPDFEELDFGPAVFERRRALWRAGELKGFGLSAALPLSSSSTAIPPSNSATSAGSNATASSQRSTSSGEALSKLDAILAEPGVEKDSDVWRSYLGDVYKKMVGGSRLRKGLKLGQAVSSLSSLSLLFSSLPFSLSLLFVFLFVFLSFLFPLFSSSYTPAGA